MSARVTIGVPVYRGGAFIEEALRSVLNQTYRDYEVIISIDEPDAESEEICGRFLGDSRFRMFLQPRRLGWMGNMSWLMGQVRNEFWHLQEQDDVIAPNFLEMLLEAALANPTAAVVYPDIRIFGDSDFSIVQESVLGSPFARQMALLRDHLAAAALIGVSRVQALRAAAGIPGNEMENFFAETVWMARMALWGELRRVPFELFCKRLHSGNTIATWFKWPWEKRLAAWQVHCVGMVEQALQIEAGPRERRLLWLAAVARLGSPVTAGKIINVDRLTSAERAEMLDGFLRRARSSTALDLPALLDADWNEIDSWARKQAREDGLL
jgi:glycosyltransferase involved in cell wall biosynthesis